jgi:putative PEP-CTERM system TPR-repeat lipoprotein
MALFLLLGGCAKKQTEEMLASARSYAEQGNWNAATIQLKNVLHDDPLSGPARLLLARAMYSMGDLSGARVEIQKAIDNKEPENEAIPLLARIMAAQGDYDELIKRFSKKQLTDQNAMVDLNTSLAFAFFRRGMTAEARENIDKALKVDSNYSRARLVQAGLEISSGNNSRAEEIVTSILQREPTNREAWQLSGDIKRLDPQRLDEALKDYERVVALKPNDPVANSNIIDIYLTQNNIAAADSQFAKMKTVLPAHPATFYFGARIAFLRGEYAGATDMSQRLLEIQPDNVRGLVLAGMIATQTRSFARAERHLLRAVQMDPRSALPRRLLANVYVMSGRPDRALSTLTPNLEADNPETESIALAAQAEMELGDMKAAEAHFLQALKQKPKDPQLRSAAALILISQGKVEEGYAELSAVAASDSGTVADMALIGAAAARRDFARALAALDRLQRKLPDKPSVAAIRGQVLLQQGNQEAAVAQFEQALATDPKYYPATEALARISIRAGKLDEAQRRFAELLKADPKNVPAMLALADIRSALKAPNDEVIAILNDAISAGPTDPRPRLKLIAFLERVNYSKRALAAAQEAAATLPDDLDVLDALGTAQLANNDLQQAKSTFGKLASLAPKSELPYLRLSEVFLRGGQQGEAIKALNQALRIQPDSNAARTKLITLYIQAKRWDDALSVARSVQKRYPDDAAGWVMEGDIEVKRHNQEAALGAFKAGIGKRQPYPAPSRYFLGLTAAGSFAQATAFADSWLASHPNDMQFAAYAAQIEIVRSDLPSAEKHLRVASRINPQDGETLNNLAWVLVRQGKSESLAYAQRAVAIAPDNPGYLDTLATAFLAANQPRTAVEAAQKAQRLASSDQRFTLTLAKAYWRDGQAELARAELAKVQKVGATNVNRGEVDRLAAEWNR